MLHYICPDCGKYFDHAPYAEDKSRYWCSQSCWVNYWRTK